MIIPRGFTSLQEKEAEYSFSGFITTNKQTNKQTKKYFPGSSTESALVLFSFAVLFCLVLLCNTEFEVKFWPDAFNKESFFLLRTQPIHLITRANQRFRVGILFPPSTERCVAQSFGGERASQLDITFLFCGHLVLFCLLFLCWRAVRDLQPNKFLTVTFVSPPPTT